MTETRKTANETKEILKSTGKGVNNVLLQVVNRQFSL